MTQQPIRKLNKRLIYWCLMGLVAMSLPALISLASFNKRDEKSERKPHEVHANMNTHDAKVIAGMENFPETYGDVDKFEREFPIAKKKEDEVLEAFARLEKTTQDTEPQRERNSHGYQGRNDDPLHEAKQRELKQRAFDRYDARRSDIMFLDNTRHQKRQPIEPESEEILRMMDKAMEAPSSNDDVLIVNNSSDKDFLSKGRRAAGELANPSAFMLSEGTLIPAILLTEINTDLPGPILARVSHNIWDSTTGKSLLIPQNSKLIGEYNSAVGNGQNRAQIVWTRIIYPNQQSVDLGRMVGVDKKGTSGTAGKVDNHYDKVAIALFMTTALSAGVRMSQGKYDPKTASIGEDVGNSLAQETARLGSKLADKMLSVKPTITVAMGERLNVFVEQDLHLSPYSG